MVLDWGWLSGSGFYREGLETFQILSGRGNAALGTCKCPGALGGCLRALCLAFGFGLKFRIPRGS